MSSKPQIHLFFDVLSPYSFLCYEAIKQSSSRLPADVFYRPVFMAAIFKTVKNTGMPALHPQKFKYMQESTARQAKFWGIEGFNIEDTFAAESLKRSSSNPMRLVTAVQRDLPNDFDRTVRALYDKLFVESQFTDSKEALEKIVSKLGLPSKILETSHTDEVKGLLRANTDEALANGAFGVPYMLLKKNGKTEHFFGVESVPQLCYSLDVDFKGPKN